MPTPPNSRSAKRRADLKAIGGRVLTSADCQEEMARKEELKMKKEQEKEKRKAEREKKQEEKRVERERKEEDRRRKEGLATSRGIRGACPAPKGSSQNSLCVMKTCSHKHARRWIQCASAKSGTTLPVQGYEVQRKLKTRPTPVPLAHTFRLFIFWTQNF
jgi:hypothetical protein